MFRGKNEDIRTTSASSVSLVDFEQVNLLWDVIKSLLNDFWRILKCYAANVVHIHLISIGTMLSCTRFFKKNAGDTFTYYILEKFNQ